MHILTVDDEPINHLVLNGILKRIFQNPTIMSSPDGQDAIKKAYTTHYNLIFMDICMPQLDGLQAAQQIRVFNQFSPIIFITALENINSISLPKNSSIIKKPINIESIKTVLNNYPKLFT